MLKRIVNTNKTYYDHLSKYGKKLGSDFVSKPEYEEPLFKHFQPDKAALNQTIAEHLYRSGFFEAGEAFRKEAAFAMSDDFKDQFRELNGIVKELRDQKAD